MKRPSNLIELLRFGSSLQTNNHDGIRRLLSENTRGSEFFSEKSLSREGGRNEKRPLDEVRVLLLIYFSCPRILTSLASEVTTPLNFAFPQP